MNGRLKQSSTASDDSSRTRIFRVRSLPNPNHSCPTTSATVNTRGSEEKREKGTNLDLSS